VHVNGELTVGENIADLGGVVIGYYAYMKSLEGKPEEIIHGMTPAQRYFIGWAIGECGYWRDEITRVATKTDPHSPPKWRVNGPFSQLSEFHEAFQTKEGDGMWVPPNERISIW
jgi:putative endopeptidase